MYNLVLSEISDAVNGSIINNTGNTDVFINMNDITTDSRKITEDCLFIAIKGEKFDGHGFITEAFEKGSKGVICSKAYFSEFKNHTPDGKFAILVEDTKYALADLAEYVNKKFDIKTVAVTGSVGKTSTKEYIYSVLSENFTVHKNIGNYNNEIGVPLTIFQLDDTFDAQVIELGMSGLGEISALSKIVTPDIAVITNIGYSHIQQLKTRENIKKAKFEILEYLKDEGTIILNADEELMFREKGRTGKNEIFISLKSKVDSNLKGNDYFISDVNIDYKLQMTSFVIIHENERYPVTINTLGSHNLYNAAIAFIVGREFGMDAENIQRGLLKFQNAKMRQNIYQFNGITIIDDCYNASLESMTAALEVLSNIAKKGKSTAVLADILELGEFAKEIHIKVAEKLMENNIQNIYLYGRHTKLIEDIIKGEAPDLYCQHFDKKTELLKELTERTKFNDTVLFKASRGMYMEQLIDSFKTRL